MRVNDQVAAHLNNKKRREVMEMEDAGKMDVQILGSEALSTTTPRNGLSRRPW